MLKILMLLFSILIYAICFAGDEECCKLDGTECLSSPGNDYVCYHWSKTVNNVFSEGRGNCTWYARYKRPDLEVIGAINAYNWYTSADNNNFAVGNVPVKGSIVVFDYYDKYDGKRYGHVAYTENVNSDEDNNPRNNKFNVTEMGYNAWDGVHVGDYQKDKDELDGIIGFIYPVGIYNDLSYNQTVLSAFLSTYNNQDPIIGWPHDNGGGVFVHKWESNTDPRYRVWLQDFVDENNEHTALVLNEYDNENKVYLLQHGFRNLYMNNDGPYNYGLPFTNEIIHGYANSPDGTSGDAIQPGSYITVQKFRQVYEENGELVYNNHRKTMVWQDGIEAQHFPVGAFTIYTCNEFQNGRQIYVVNNKYPLDPFMDIPWPVEGVAMQNGTTGEWFTKVGSYNFVIHNPDGSRKQGTGLSVLITEGNSQFAGDVSLNHSLSPPTGFRFAN